MTGTAVSIDLSGPFFKRDPGETLRGNIERMMEGVAQEGEAAARDAYRATQGGREVISLLGDRVADHVVGRVVSVAGKRWRASAVISIRNTGYSANEAVSLMAAASSVEGRTHVMRTLSRDLRNARAVLTANLSAGIE